MLQVLGDKTLSEKEILAGVGDRWVCPMPGKGVNPETGLDQRGWTGGVSFENYSHCFMPVYGLIRQHTLCFLVLVRQSAGISIEKSTKIRCTRISFKLHLFLQNDLSAGSFW